MKSPPGVVARDAGRLWPLRDDQQDIARAITMKLGHRLKIGLEHLALSVLKTHRKTGQSLACDFFCFFDFHLPSLVSGTSCPLHTGQRGQGPETGKGSSCAVLEPAGASCTRECHSLSRREACERSPLSFQDLAYRVERNSCRRTQRID
jgi:hypothetical protein